MKELGFGETKKENQWVHYRSPQIAISNDLRCTN